MSVTCKDFYILILSFPLLLFSSSLCSSKTTVLLVFKTSCTYSFWLPKYTNSGVIQVIRSGWVKNVWETIKKIVKPWIHNWNALYSLVYCICPTSSQSCIILEQIQNLKMKKLTKRHKDVDPCFKVQYNKQERLMSSALERCLTYWWKTPAHLTQKGWSRSCCNAYSGGLSDDQTVEKKLDNYSTSLHQTQKMK